MHRANLLLEIVNERQISHKKDQHTDSDSTRKQRTKGYLMVATQL